MASHITYRQAPHDDEESFVGSMGFCAHVRWQALHCFPFILEHVVTIFVTLVMGRGLGGISP